MQVVIYNLNQYQLYHWSTASSREINLELGLRLVKDHAVDTGSDALQRNLDIIAVLQPQSRLATHAHALGSVKQSVYQIQIICLLIRVTHVPVKMRSPGKSVVP